MDGFKVWALGLGVAFTVAFVARLIVANRVPDAPSAPTLPLPRPNAFDTYHAAAKHLKNGDALREAFTAVVQTDNAPGATPTERGALLAPNRETLRLLRVGLREAYGEPPLRRWDASRPYYTEHRDMTRLLVLEGWTRLDAHDDASAAASWLDALEFGQQIARGGPIITRLVSVACQAIARRPLWINLNRLDAETAKTSARRLESVSARRVPQAETWTEEKYWGQVTKVALWRGEPGAEHSLFAPQPTPDDGLARRIDIATSEWTARQVTYFIWTKKGILDNYGGYMDQMIARSKVSYGQRGPIPPPPPDLYNRLYLQVFSPTELKFAASEDTQTALLTVALALRAFRLETGAYPVALSDVVKAGYLSEIPADPFAPSVAPLQYRRTANAYVLYSVGPDGVDDGGTAINNPNGKTKNAHLFVEPQSKGDIVAGVNVY